MRKILAEGVHRHGRNGGTYGLFGEKFKVNLADGFPLLTTKRVYFKTMAHELLWFLKGDSSLDYLHANNVHIWDSNAKAGRGELGPIYGVQWRDWGGRHFMGKHQPGTDQITELMEGLKKDPYGRRHIVSAWNVTDIPHMALPPCHVLFQFWIAEDKLHCQMYQRSADLFLGVPFNLSCYALLTQMIATQLGYGLGYFHQIFGDVHIYADHLEQCKEQLTRAPKPMPWMNIRLGVPDLLAYCIDDFELVNYDPHPAIAAPMSV